MKRTFKFFEILILMCGVFGADEDKVKSVSVMEGDSVTLNPDLTQIQGVIQRLWRFGDPGLTIARIDEDGISFSDDKTFEGRLQLNQTGSLTIKNMRIKHSGLYKLKIDHNTGTSDQKFSVAVHEPPSVIDAAEVEMKIMSVVEGDPVTLHVPQLQGNELIVWRFGDGGKLIAKQDIEAKSSLLYDTDERFRDRLQLNDQTGSLIITNTRTTDSGFYTVKISSNKQTLYRRFTVSAVPDSGLSPGVVAGIVFAVLLVSAAAAAGVMYYCRPKTSKLPSQTWSVPVGDCITLNPDTEIQPGDEIQWLFRDEDTLIAQIRRETREMTTYEGPDGIFTYRLKLGETTGSLTIDFITTKHSGLYTLKIRRGRETLYKRFMVSVEERTIAVMRGEYVTLHPDTGIQRDDEIQWLFDDKEKQTVLAEIKTREVTKYDGPNERFRDGLKLNKETGSLTITKFTALHSTHSEFYTLKIRRGTETLYKRFYIFLKKETAVMEGDPVTLNPDTKIEIEDDSILWMFRHEEQQTLIAEIKGETGEFWIYDFVPDGRFRGSLDLDKTTGSLIITNTRTEHSGVYTLEIRSSRGVSDQTFIVTVKDEVEERLLKEDSVTLNPDTEIQRDDQILWMFGAQDKLIAQIRGGTVETYDDDKRFKGRLKLDKTGSLTITNIRAEHIGLYKLLTISSSRGILFKKFKVLIHLKYETVIVGDSVHLYTGLTEIQRDDEIQWRFGDENSLIAKIKGGTVETYDGPDGRFRDRLELNKMTGDLTISNSAAEHTGYYKLNIRRSEGNTSRTFIVTIRGAAVTNEARKKSEMKKNDSTENRVNESATVMMPLLNGDDLDVVNEEDYVNVVNEEEGTSSL